MDYKSEKIYSFQSPFEFKNWAGNINIKPEFIHYPTNEEEIREIILKAKEENLPVKVIGKGHSCNEIAVTKGHMISLKRYNKMIEYSIENKKIKVESGIEIGELNKKLDELGLALPNQLSVSDLTIGGIISTGSHGSGKNYSIFSSHVLEIEMMIWNGDVLKLNRNENQEIFQCALCSLGSLGILLRIELQVVEKYSLEFHQKILKFETILNCLKDLKEENEFFRVLWYPHTNGCVVQTFNKTKKKDLFKKEKESLFGNKFLEFILYLSKFLPFLNYFINKFYLFLEKDNVNRIENSHQLLNMDCHLKQHVNEWSIPEKNISLALSTLREFLKNEKIKAHFPIEIRYAKQDDIYLSPAFQRNSYYIGIISYRPYHTDFNFFKYFRGFDKIMLYFDGRPHWSKNFQVSKKEFQKMYPYWNRFWEIQSKLDPQKMFWNSFIENLHQD